MTRTKGTGSVYQRASDGLWIASLEAGWTSRGTRRRITVSAKTKRDALAKAKERQRQIALTGLPAEGVRRATTVKAYAEQYLRAAAHRLRPSALQVNSSAVTRWIIPTVGHIRLDLITPAHVELVGLAAQQSGLSASTARRYQQVLVVVLKDALRNGHAIAPAALLADLPTPGRVKRGAIPLDDALAITKAALTLPDGARWLLALLAAVRPAEVAGLLWENVDLERGLVTVAWQLKPLPYLDKADRTAGFRVPVGYEANRLVHSYHLVRPKTSQGERVLPMVAPLQAALEAWKECSPESPYGLVFPRVDGSPLPDKVNRDDWRALLELAGVGSYDLYEARHTTATLLRSARVDEETITAIMGHSSIRSTAAYLHTDLDRMRAALSGVAGALGAKPLN